MKREHKLEQSYIDWLKSLGCVFYAPLNGVNETMDVINNVQLTTTGYGAYSYDAAKDTSNMEATIQHTDNRFIAIIAAVLLLLFTLLFFNTHNFTTTTTIPQVEVLQWSADTCWGKW